MGGTSRAGLERGKRGLIPRPQSHISGFYATFRPLGEVRTGRHVRSERIKTPYVGLGLSERLVALVPPPDTLSGCDPREANREQFEPEPKGGTTEGFGSSCERVQKPTEAENNEPILGTGRPTAGRRYSACKQ